MAVSYLGGKTTLFHLSYWSLFYYFFNWFLFFLLHAKIKLLFIYVAHYLFGSLINFRFICAFFQLRFLPLLLLFTSPLFSSTALPYCLIIQTLIKTATSSINRRIINRRHKLLLVMLNRYLRLNIFITLIGTLIAIFIILLLNLSLLDLHSHA